LPKGLDGRDCFVAGDWNCVPEPAIDSTNPNLESPQGYLHQFQPWRQSKATGPSWFKLPPDLLEKTDNNRCDRWARTKLLLKPRLVELSYRLAKARTKKDPAALALRARLPPELIGPASVYVRLRQVRVQDLVDSLVSKEGERLEEPEDMLKECMSFFGDLYTSEPSSMPDRRELLSNLTAKVDPLDRINLDRPFDEDELQLGLRRAKNKSAPGPDGLSYAFYAATWDVSGPILTECLNALMEGAGPSSPEHITNLVLLHKDGDKDQLKNKRPISLINIDERPDQTGFIPGRQIGENIEAVQNIQAVLLKFGFGPKIRRVIMGSSTNTKARVVLNGWLSAPVSIGRGVRQGSPLAPSIFALCMEPLAAKLRNDLVGIRHTGLDNCQTKIRAFKASLFADDLAAGLAGRTDSMKLNEALALFKFLKEPNGMAGESKEILFGILESKSELEWIYVRPLTCGQVLCYQCLLLY